LRAHLLSFIAGILVLAPSAYMLEVYDRVIQSRNHLTLLMLTLAVVLAYVVMEALEYLRSEMLRELGDDLDKGVSVRIFRIIFDAALRKHPGGSMQPLNDWRQVREFLHSPFVLAALEAPVALVYLLLVFAIDPALGWMTCVGAVVQFGIAWRTERSTQQPLAAANRSAVAAQLYADASLRNAEVIEAMGMLGDIHSRWLKLQRRFLGEQSEASLAAGGLQAAAKMVQQVLGSALLGLGAWLTLRHQMGGNGGLIVVASIIGGRVLAPLVQMVAQWRQVVNAREAWQRLDYLLTSFPERSQPMPLPPPRGVLTVEQLVAGPPVLQGAGGGGQPGRGPAQGAGTSFGTTALTVLRGVQFALQPGELLAVVGPSAAGKTTLARMLVGLWPAISGKVRLDGADVFAWDKKELGPHVGYLPQGVELFEGSIADNIARFGDTDAAAVEQAARAVGLHDFISDLPQGYQTLVGRDGANLSGGQRQRVALARALYGEPALVVLDEPNSNLDEAGDLALSRALNGLKARGATVVVMTHRTSILAVTDKVLVLIEGVQKAFGPRDEVMGALQKGNQQSETPANASRVGVPAVINPSASSTAGAVR